MCDGFEREGVGVLCTHSERKQVLCYGSEEGRVLCDGSEGGWS